jgi:UDP-N-acetylglucosamine--N-acetylmuramyl-(pentapeptide) pyrophosphoryl-undecaprenol N-acetylglucosamine transferase
MSRTILFQPPNRIGLGHISRLIAIALAVKAADPEVRLPFVIEGHGHGLIEASGLPHFCLPSSYDLYETAQWAQWDRSERQIMLLDVASSLVQALAPELIVFDCFPNSAMVNAALEYRIPVAIVLRKARQMSDYFDRILALSSAVQLILIAHGEGQCEVPASLRARTRFTGQIVRAALPPRERDGDGEGGGHAEAPHIVISGGGGGYPGTVEFYSLALSAFARVRQQMPHVTGLLVTGPLFEEWKRLRLVDGIKVLPFDPRLSETFARASLVVCQAGYNTVSEVLSHGVPAICVPAERLADDQFERARQSASGHTSFQVYEGSDADAFAALMLAALHRPRASAARSADVPDGHAAPAYESASPTFHPTLSGAPLAAAALLRLLTPD